MTRPKCSANDAYLVYTKPWGFPFETVGGDLCQVAVAETVEPQEPEAPEEPEEAAEEAHVFLTFFNRFWFSLSQGFHLFFDTFGLLEQE